MFAYVARQPIFDANQEVYAYELLFRNGEDNCFPDISPDEATSKILAGSHLSAGLEEVVGSHPAFINFHRDTLINHFPTSLHPGKVVIEIVETVEVDEQLIEACKHIYEMGYSLALDDYDALPKWAPFLDFVSIVKFDITTISEEQLRATIPALKARNIQLVAEKIETHQQFEYYKSLGFDFFQGYFLARPEVVRHRKLGPSQLTMLELLAISGSGSLDYEQVNRIVERDVSLTYLLLRFINNPLVNKRHKIGSLKHALAFMGEVEIKKFIALVSLANLCNDSSTALLQMSLVRAKFCEQVSLALNLQENPPTGFLTGLLSMLDAIMATPMQELMSKVPVGEAVKEALCGEPNVLLDCLQLVKHIEQANWKGVRILANKHQLNQRRLHHFYQQAVIWANSVGTSVEPSASDTEAEMK
ncbi:EAL domain-containing protein [Alteromonas aestuariivivens]|uniref:EAL domain-containing protein n=1 Tax=Alteromonas aestuariivivens TaxID=1938339 RepID=A0A3D8M4W9_9ALTE|nr:EAL domain-containing protein [Alteromonas aestuariivivens]RDV24192.1 EAL domain-containing protein [Alteromonas aestuariivivens]